MPNIVTETVPVKDSVPTHGVVAHGASGVINAREEKREEIFIALRTATEHGNQLLRGRECYSRGMLLAQGVRCSSFRPVPD